MRTFAVLGLAGTLLCLAYRWLSRRTAEARTRSEQELERELTVLFFPDNEVACRTHFTQLYGCANQRCRFSHDPRSAYAQLLRSES